MSAVESYEITVEGHLSPGWSDWLEGLNLRRKPGGETVLRGPLRDQAALHSVLIKLHDLGLKLIAVNRIDADY